MRPGALTSTTAGNVYVAGETSSILLPQDQSSSTLSGFSDAFVTKFNPDGLWPCCTPPTWGAPARMAPPAALPSIGPPEKLTSPGNTDSLTSPSPRAPSRLPLAE